MPADDHLLVSSYGPPGKYVFSRNLFRMHSTMGLRGTPPSAPLATIEEVALGRIEIKARGGETRNGARKFRAKLSRVRVRARYISLAPCPRGDRVFANAFARIASVTPETRARARVQRSSYGGVTPSFTRALAFHQRAARKVSKRARKARLQNVLTR